MSSLNDPRSDTGTYFLHGSTSATVVPDLPATTMIKMLLQLFPSILVNQGSHTLRKTQGNDLSMEIQGNLWEFAKLLREVWKTEKYQGILREFWFWPI